MNDFLNYARMTRTAISALVLRTKDRIIADETRKGIAKLTRILRPQNGVSMKQKLDDISKFAADFENTTSAWLTAEDIKSGKKGDFDTMNLLSWLEIVKETHVPHIPARVIARFSSEEMSLASGIIEQDFIEKRPIFKQIKNAYKENSLTAEETEASPDKESQDALKEALNEKIFSAMDSVSDHEMVRYSRCGGTNLKSIAGAGLAGPESPNVTFAPTLAAGPGWIRRGNRRMLDLVDNRIMNSAATTPDNYVHEFVARPWVASSRWVTGMDIHREDTPVAGPGAWPAEWRAFVCNGVVTGVSAYYAWAHKSTPTDAKMALKVRKLAQQIVDAAIEKGLRPAFYDLDLYKNVLEDPNSPLRQNENFDKAKEYLEAVPPGGFNATIDFLETEAGPAFLEAGPPIMAWGLAKNGGHSLAFSAGLTTALFDWPDVTGAALSQPPTMTSTDVQSWASFPREGHVFSWEQVEEMAQKQ